MPRSSPMPLPGDAGGHCLSVTFRMNEKVVLDIVEPIPPPVGRVFPIAMPKLLCPEIPITAQG